MQHKREAPKMTAGRAALVELMSRYLKGLLDPAAVAAAIRPETILISIMHANNEVGSIQPIPEIAALAAGRDILVHTDAAQSLGKIAVRVDELGVEAFGSFVVEVPPPLAIGTVTLEDGSQVKGFVAEPRAIAPTEPMPR